jgi:hypothetical protein
MQIPCLRRAGMPVVASKGERDSLDLSLVKICAEIRNDGRWLCGHPHGSKSERANGIPAFARTT